MGLPVRHFQSIQHAALSPGSASVWQPTEPVEALGSSGRLLALFKEGEQFRVDMIFQRGARGAGALAGLRGEVHKRRGTSYRVGSNGFCPGSNCWSKAISSNPVAQ